MPISFLSPVSGIAGVAGPARAVQPRPVPRPTPTPVPRPDAWRPSSAPPLLTRNDATVHVDAGEAFPAMEAMLRSARKSIRVDYYLFGGTQADRIIDILVKKKQAGVDVRVILDSKRGEIPKYQQSIDASIARMREAGIEVLFYPVQGLVPGKPQAGRIDHNKIVVVDGQQGMAGGMNILDDFLNNHDVMVQVRGPVVGDLKRQFDAAWSLAGGSQVPPPDGPAPAEQGDARVRVLSTGLNGTRSAEQVLMERLAAARDKIYVEMFLLTSRRLVDTLIAAKQRGVDVRVLTDPGEHGRMLGLPLPNGVPNLWLLYRLADAGIQVRWFKLKPDQVHAHLKMSIIDGSAIVGSHNWTDSALGTNAETSFEIRGGRAYDRLLNMFAGDWNLRSRSVARPTMARRGEWGFLYWRETR